MLTVASLPSPDEGLLRYIRGCETSLPELEGFYRVSVCPHSNQVFSFDSPQPLPSRFVSPTFNEAKVVLH